MLRNAWQCGSTALQGRHPGSDELAGKAHFRPPREVRRGLLASQLPTAIASAAFKFESGATAQICTSVLFDAPSRLEIYGSKGWVICENTFGREGARRIWTTEGDFAFPVVNPFVGLLEDFVQAILQRRKPEVDAIEGARNAEILLELVEEN